MHTETGEIKPLEAIKFLPKQEQAKFVEIKRSLTNLEKFDKQIRMYNPCGCGSGIKFKFCCYRKNIES